MFENIYQSKYKGKEVDSAVEKVLSNKFATQESLEQINTNKLDKGAKISELINDGDGNSKFITEKKTSELLEEINSNLTNKVDKEDGKGLSSNDFTDDEKAKLESLPNSTELNNRMNLKADKEAMENLLAGKVDKVNGEKLIPEEDLQKLNELPTRENLEWTLTTMWTMFEEISSEKQNISNELTIVPDNYGAASISLDGKVQHYYLESINPDNNSLGLDIFYEGFKNDEFTFYLYMNLSSEIPMSFVLSLIKPSEGVMSVKWLEEPTIDYPHTKMLLAFQTTDGGVSWIANQCYSLEVTE